MAIHVTPINDLHDHEESTTCKCGPSVKFENGEMIVIHNSFDGRERNERQETGVLSRSGDMIYVGDTVESVQGTRFTVVKHFNQFAIENEQGRFELKPYMSPNLWIVNE